MASAIPYLPSFHCHDIPLHSIGVHSFEALTLSVFQEIWGSGSPLLVTDVGRRFKFQWNPEYFIENYGDKECFIVDPQTDYSKKVTVRDFFTEFGNYAGRGTTFGGNSKKAWKLKDWPPSAAFQEEFPELFEDFSNAVPMPSYVRKDGVLNIAAHFPMNAVAPDLGPKMYNAMASDQTLGSKGTTRLHLDIADAVNVMTYAADCPDGSPGCAAWDLFRPEDLGKLQRFLKERLPESCSDPVYSQQIYLDEHMR
ncbi:hypothetical protein GYMLUDRAFT_182204 [Collybiopsis luxurians FD-317 M1]|uniref:JmjC domain-containing protein n=1 Tax=Collybiopsis luxurians FD-317 M1 TaxID=944289 RepID=A0A0D0BZM5_9AGAR|nr:hypothetical protein GYMLUDRAFT_182204 [Collybiopsis luxurians FD-317 M1]